MENLSTFPASLVRMLEDIYYIGFEFLLFFITSEKTRTKKITYR